MDLAQQKSTDIKCIKITHLENKTGVEFCVDNLLNQLLDAGYIKSIRNRYVVRWPRGVGIDCVDTECFVLLQNEDDMESLFHYFDGYRFHNQNNMLKVEWGWFTFRNTYSPLPNVRECSVCDATFKKYVLNIY